MFWFGLIVGLFVGGFGIGIVAHRRPQWFASAVALTNMFDDRVKAEIAKRTRK